MAGEGQQAHHQRKFGDGAVFEGVALRPQLVPSLPSPPLKLSAWVFSVPDAVEYRPAPVAIQPDALERDGGIRAH